MDSIISGEVEYFYYEGQLEEMEDGTFIIALKSVQSDDGHNIEEETNISTLQFDESSEEFSYASIDGNKNLEDYQQKSSIFSCSLCEYTAKKNYTLKRHVNAVHLNLKEHSCNWCEYASNSKWNLKKHIERKHGDVVVNSETNSGSKEGYKCDYCGFATLSENYIKQHIKNLHLQSGKYCCHICQYRSNFNNDLQKHLNSVHFKTAEYACKMCQFTSFDKSNFKRHTKTKHGGN